MSLLHRYILSIFTRLLLLSLGAFVGIFLLVDFLEKVDDFIEHGAAPSLYILYLLNMFPIAAAQVIPLAILLAAFGTLGGLSKSNELTAMRGGGINIWRITLPLLASGLLLSIGLFFVNELLIPVNQKKIHYLLRNELRGKQEILFKRDNIWFRENGTIYHVRQSQPENNILLGVTILEFNESFHLISRRDAPLARYTEGSWIFENLVSYRYAPDTSMIIERTRFPQKSINLAKKPEDFTETLYKAEQLGFFELRSLVEKMRNEGYNPRNYQVDMHARLAYPFTCLTMTMLGIPFALRKGRSASLAVGVTLSVAVGVVFFILQTLLTTLGYSAVVPPFVAAWSALLIFTLLAVWLLLSTRD